MKKKSSIIKFSLVGVFLIIGVILSFVPMSSATRDWNGFARSISLGLDLQGGVFALYEGVIIDPDTGDASTPTSSAMEATRTRLSEMLASQGFSDATVVIEGGTRIRVEVPDVDEPEELLRIIGEPAQLEFVHNNNVILTGRNVENATPGIDPSTGGHVVHLRLDSAGAHAFAQATSHIGDTIYIYSIVGTGENARRTVVSAPTVQSQITGGNAIITGMPDAQTAQNLADQIIAGQFSVVLTRINSDVVSPTLGENALMFGLIAGLIGILLIMAFMAFFYRMFGVLSAASLLGYTILMLFFLAALPWVQLTLPGIAGILLSIGMSVDGNIIMFERIKDEFRNGKSIKSASFAGLKKGFWPVFDAEITTVIAAVVLLIFGTGPIQSFAITLLVGIVLAMFFNLVVLRYFVKWLLPFNSTNAKWYNLKRSAAYADLPADQTDVSVAERDAELEKIKAEKRAEKQAVKAARKGGKANEAT